MGSSGGMGGGGVGPKLDEILDLSKTVSKVFWAGGVADRTRVWIISVLITYMWRLEESEFEVPGCIKPFRHASHLIRVA